VRGSYNNIMIEVARDIAIDLPTCEVEEEFIEETHMPR
jgi:hypothetical protein